MTATDIDLTCVASFVALARETHYSRVSADLHITPSALTKRIHRLERQLGVRLVDRRPDGTMGVTSDGLRFVREAEALLSQARAAWGAVQRNHVDVHLGLVGSVAAYPRRNLARVGHQLRRRHPDARLVCHGLLFTALASSLLDGQVDVVWGASSTPHPEIALTRMSKLGRIGLVGAGHELADAGQMGVEAFADLPLLHNPALPAEWMHPWCLADVRPPTEAWLVATDANTPGAVVRAVAQGPAAAVIFVGDVPFLPPQVRTVVLTGASPVQCYAARRRTDRRDCVFDLLDALQCSPVEGVLDASTAS